jgi:hypothetical protein
MCSAEIKYSKISGLQYLNISGEYLLKSMKRQMYELRYIGVIKMKKNKDEFIGTWKLSSIETRDEKGDLVRRGRRKGYLIYSQEGYMSVSFMKEDRPKFKSDDIRGGTTEEKIDAINGYLSYAGKYTVKENTVIHQIEVSLFPNWVGEAQERMYSFEKDQLTLSTPLMLVGGKKLSTHLVWEKV